MQTRAARPAKVLLGDPDAVGSMLSLPGVVRTGHFELLSGWHTDTFLAFSSLASVPDVLGELADWMAPSLAAWRPDLVLAPSTAGVALGGAIARRLQVPLALASLNGSSRALGVLGDTDLRDRRVLLVNDVYTTGHGLGQLSDVVSAHGGDCVGAAWFLTRCPEDGVPHLSVPHLAVAATQWMTWAMAECPLCKTVGGPEHAIDLN